MGKPLGPVRAPPQPGPHHACTPTTDVAPGDESLVAPGDESLQRTGVRILRLEDPERVGFSQVLPMGTAGRPEVCMRGT